MKTLLSITLLLVATLSVAGPASTQHLPSNDKLAVGSESPWISGWTPDNKVWNLKKAFASDATRRTVLVFWATWCAPCKAGLREITEAADQLAEAGVEVILVNLDQDQAAVTRFLDTYPMPFLCILDPYQTASRRYFGLKPDGPALTLPRTVLINRDRMVEAVLGREGRDYLSILLAD